MEIGFRSLNVKIHDETTKINNKEIKNPFTKAIINLLTSFCSVIVCAIVAVATPVLIPLSIILLLVGRNGFFSFPKQNNRFGFCFNTTNAFKKR